MSFTHCTIRSERASSTLIPTNSKNICSSGNGDQFIQFSLFGLRIKLIGSTRIRCFTCTTENENEKEMEPKGNLWKCFSASNASACARLHSEFRSFSFKQHQKEICFYVKTFPARSEKEKLWEWKSSKKHSDAKRKIIFFYVIYRMKNCFPDFNRLSSFSIGIPPNFDCAQMFFCLHVNKRNKFATNIGKVLLIRPLGRWNVAHNCKTFISAFFVTLCLFLK